MNLTHIPDFVNWSVAHYVFIEKVGPFQKTAQKAWQELIAAMPQVKEKITGRMSLYRFDPEMVYRAGVIVSSQPEKLPEGLQYEKFEGGKYARYVLTGPYQDLPEACSQVFKMLPGTNLKVRAGAYYLENYVNDPATTTEDKLITEILIPVF